MEQLIIMLAFAAAQLVHGFPMRGKYGDNVVMVPRQIDDLPTFTTVVTSFASSLVDPSQSVSVTAAPTITGSINTLLPTNGAITIPPVGPTITPTWTTLSPIDSTLSPGPTIPMGEPGPDVFVPVATDLPPPQIQQRSDHLVSNEHVKFFDGPIGTNKFYSNLFLGSQTAPIFTNPYSLAWAKGGGNTWGMAVVHVERSQFDWDKEQTPPRYFTAPLRLQNIVLTAEELGPETVLSVTNLTTFSAVARFAPRTGQDDIMWLPCVQGMGFVTAVYNGAKPVLKSGTLFRTLVFKGPVNDMTYKYEITMDNGNIWLLYVTPEKGSSTGPIPFDLDEQGTISYGSNKFYGILQVAKNPIQEGGDQIYDSSAGAFPVSAKISATVQGVSGSYTIQWQKDGIPNRPLLMFALPHHVESFSDETTQKLTALSLDTISKGLARAVQTDQFTMIERDLPTSIGFEPWSATSGSVFGSNRKAKRNNVAQLAENVVHAVKDTASFELGQDLDKLTRLDSMYFSGKALARLAMAVYALQDMAGDTNLAAAGLEKLKAVFAVFVNNQQPYPLVYDSMWKGVVSSGSYANGNIGVDFGNSVYNDHHFHYGYFVLTAAYIGYLDPKWLDEGTNRAWINTLVRDYANPSDADPFFPQLRSMDFYHGHSWAKGVTESFDGKDQESSSEDIMSSYALKMWAYTTSNANLHAMANLMLAVQKRSINNYFLMTDSNTVQPPQFVPNRVTGILFENKIHHATYFGAATWEIEGIHMLPVLPITPYIRSAEFSRQEWDTYFSGGRAENPDAHGWRGILYSGLSLIDPKAAYDFFADPNFDYGLLDPGQSRAYYLAYTAALAGHVAGPPQVPPAGELPSVVPQIEPPVAQEKTDGTTPTTEDSTAADWEGEKTLTTLVTQYVSPTQAVEFEPETQAVDYDPYTDDRS